MKIEDMIGKKFEMLTVLGKDETRKHYCRCKCECGETKSVRKDCLTRSKDNVKSCGCIKKENLIGKRFGRWVVIKEALTTDESTKWFCRCDCGKSREVNAGSLKAGSSISCGCARKNLFSKKNITGQRFGRLIAIKECEKRNNAYFWLCECDCGKSKEIRRSSLVKGGTKSCGCLKEEFFLKNKLKKGEANFNRLFYGYQKSAIKRDIYFDLNKEEFKLLTQQKCYYCDSPPSNIAKSKTLNGDYIYNGIDRVDNDKGYIIENCVPCCKMCNKMKINFSKIDFFNRIKEIYNKHLKKNLLIVENK